MKDEDEVEEDRTGRSRYRTKRRVERRGINSNRNVKLWKHSQTTQKSADKNAFFGIFGDKNGLAKIMQVYNVHNRAVKLGQRKGVMTHVNEKNTERNNAAEEKQTAVENVSEE